MTNDLQDAYRYCEQLARASGSSFFRSFRLLPAEQRQAMYALYAFSRQTDDLADSNEPAETRRVQIADWRHQLREALGGNGRSPVWQALYDTKLRFAIPDEYFVAIVDGVAMDLSAPYYETFEELGDYCYHVASAVGLACIHIFGFEDPRAKRLAVTCGVAFQLTNILRDLSEDAVQGRIYLPREELAQFDCHPEDFQPGQMNSRVRELVRFQIARAEQLYDEAAPLASLLHPRGRRAFVLMFSTYRTLLGEIKRRDGDVFSRPVRLGHRGKLKAFFTALRFHVMTPKSTNDQTAFSPHAQHMPSPHRPAVRQSES